MFADKNEFSIHIEQIQKEQNLTAIEAVVWFTENETDQEYEQIVKMLNKKLRDKIEYEARQSNLMKDKTKLVSLFGE